MAVLLLIMQFLPAILQGVVAVEAALPGAPGQTKKDVLMSAIAAGAKVGATVPEAHVQAMSAVIDSVVAALNQTGWFKPGVAVAAVAAH